jgi:DsbC/DsbD-like thiol-disulfide interchange protein
MTIRQSYFAIALGLVALSLAACAIDSAAAAPPPASQLVKPTLLADVSSIAPGQPFTVGVLMRLAPKWHVYWINPGDSGLVPGVEWKLPPGFSAGDLQFPVPKKIDLPGGLVNYGYEDAVMLTTTIMPPRDLAAGASVPIDAKLTYLVCNEDNCVPGDAKLHLDLQTSASPTPANEQLFKDWRAQLPAPISSSLKFEVTQQPKGVQVAFMLADPNLTEVRDWFPAPGENVAVKNINIDHPADGQTRVSFTVEALGGQKIADEISFPSVLSYSHNDQPRGISVPVRLNLTANAPAASAQPAGR